jgi:HAD superfamily hydrolase (TIGR01484 family)
MRYLALATDYDGTLAHHGQVDAPTHAALVRLRAAGRKVVLVTGRELDELKKVCPHLDLFDLVVAENGALIYRPDRGTETLLAKRPPTSFVNALRARGVSPLSVGRAIVATWEPFQAVVVEEIRKSGLELQVILNKGAVMILPTRVNKATGLTAALDVLGIAFEQVVGVGDAENDHAFLTLCGLSVAVANALPALKDRADLITCDDHGAGVVEVIDALIDNDLIPRLRCGRTDEPPHEAS